MTKRVFLVLTVVFFVFSIAGSLWSLQEPKEKYLKMLKCNETQDYSISRASGVFFDSHCDEDVILSPYDTIIGCTYYDYQHNSRIPRMNANDYQMQPGRHYCYTRQTESPRFVEYNYWNSISGWLSYPSVPITDAHMRAGYCGIALLRDSRAVVFYHTAEPWDPNPDDMGVAMSIEPTTPGQGEFIGGVYWYDVPDSGGTGFKGMWPAAAVDSLDRIHIVMREGNTDPGFGWLGYVRCMEWPLGDTIFCEAPGKPVYIIEKETQYFDPLNEVAIFDSSGVISQMVATSKVSNKVALVWASLAESADYSSHFQECNDIFYIESNNGGDNWFTYPDSMQMQRNCSNYQEDDLIRAYGDVSAVYDFNGELHVYWHTHYYDQGTNETDVNDIALWHFSESTKKFCDGDTIYANKIHEVKWEDAEAGAWNRLISKIGSGVGIIYGDNENYLYVTWTQFDSSTESAAGYSQGDIYATLSTDAGMTWMLPVNITNSTADDCEEGDCASDHWSSMAEWVDDYIHLQWIYDLDAGGAPQDEGESTNDPVLVYDFDKDNIPLENMARISWTPSDFLVPYVHCPTSGVVTRYLTIENIGTAALTNIALSETAGWLSVSPTNIASIAAGGCPVNVTLTITGQGAEEFYVDSIHVTSNDQAGNNDFYIRLHVVMSDVYVAERDSTYSNPIMYVGVSNVGNLGHQSDTTGFYLYQDVNKPSHLYDGSVLLGFTAPNGDSLVGRWIFNEHYLLPERDLVETHDPNLKTLIIDAKFNPTTPQAPLPWHHRWWFWTIRTKDYIFYSEASNNNNEQYVALRYILLLYNAPPPWWPDITAPSFITPHYLGMGLDIDCPSDFKAKNDAYQDQDRRLAYLRGYGGGANENYRMGIAQRDTCYWFDGPVGPVYCCWPDPNTVEEDAPYAMHILRNDSVVYPYKGYDDPELYKWMNTPGNSIQPDAQGDTLPADYNIVATGRTISAGSFPPVDTHQVAYALVVSDRYEVDHMDSTVDMLICGNANRDQSVTVADVVYIVNYLFKGGEEPFLFMSDADGSGVVTIADAVYLVSYLFKNGSPPQCSSDW